MTEPFRRLLVLLALFAAVPCGFAAPQWSTPPPGQFPSLLARIGRMWATQPHLSPAQLNADLLHFLAHVHGR